MPSLQSAAESFELRFHALRLPGRGMSFPCDATGHVNLDLLSDKARSNYLYARVVVGNEFAWPVVQRATH